MENKVNKDFNFGSSNTMSYSVKELKAIKEEGGSKVKKHYEFWGSLVSNYNLSKIFNFALILIVFSLCGLCYFLSNKPSMVFRTESSGKSSNYIPQASDSVFNEEIIHYTSRFIECHRDLNPVSVEKSLESALKMTTTKVRDDLLKEINDNEYIETARKYKPTYHLEIGDIEVKIADHPYYTSFCIVNVSFLKPRKFIRVHNYEITWKKYKRSIKNPSGLYITKLDHYDQGNIHKKLKIN